MKSRFASLTIDLPCSSENGFLSLDNKHILLLSNRTTKVFNMDTGLEEFFNETDLVDSEEKSFLDFLFGCNVSLKLSKDGSMYLYCERELASSFYRKNYYLQVLFDVDTLKPALPVYSSLRDSFIEITDYFTLEDFLREEIYYTELVDKFLSGMEKTSKVSTRKTILSYFEED